MEPPLGGTRRETGELKAREGWSRLSSRQRKHKTSSTLIFPIHIKGSPESDGEDQTVREVSPEDRRKSEIASAIVAVKGRGLSGGFPRQRSEISCNNNCTAMH